MARRALLVLALLAVFPVASAHAVPGGSLAGTLTIDWSAPERSGRAEVVLDPGEGPKQAAIAAVRSSIPHYRRPYPYFIQGAHIAALRGENATSYDCGEGTVTKRTTVGTLRDARLPFSIDGPTLDLRRGRGTTRLGPWEDNPGYPGSPDHGAYFFPVPGRVAVRRSASGCGDVSPPASEDDEINAFDWRGESAVPIEFARWIEGWDVPLRHRAGSWAAAGKVRTIDHGVTLDVAYDLRFVGRLRSWGASCTVPDDRELGRAPGSALAVMRRAGFPRAVFAGGQRTAGHPSGRLFVDDRFTSSGYAQCLVTRPKIFRALPRRG